ncbi:hypothetical protein TWF694_008366 [Orbilia ellipsospora]|uniref:Gamma-butyrobetaine dioxygenase n=1 Tax=Orbilia ellipsospora TaxID=2528407 RepID=A0AAV9XFW3_9PEZI
MASTFRSAIRCSGAGSRVSFRRQIATAPTQTFSSISHPPHSRRTQICITKRNTSFTTIPTRQLNTTAHGAQTADQPKEDVEETRLDIPAFQFSNIFPGGVLPPTKTLKVNIDGQPFTFDNVFLRDSCTCPTCVDLSTQQKLFTTSDIPVDIYPRRARVSNGKLKIEWSHSLSKSAVAEEKVNNYHWSFYDVEFLKNSSVPVLSVRSNMSDWRRVFWDRRSMVRDVFWIEYGEWMHNDVEFAKALKQLSLYGLIFIKNVPDGKQIDRVAPMARRVGNLKNTFYGETWSVQSVPESKNIAYTSLDLGLHMDLLYFESPPGLQFLHCVESSVVGGSSYFVDAFRAAFMLQQSAPRVFDTLTKFPVNFHYHNDSRHYRFARPIVVMKGLNENYHPENGIDHMNWAPPFQAPFTMDHNGAMVSGSSTWRTFLKGIAALNEMFEDPLNQFELQLSPGDCAVFFNRRILHARRGFDASSGRRRLTGGYVDIDAFESACRVMAERFPDGGKGKKGKGGAGGSEYEYLAGGSSGGFGHNQWT